MSWLSESVRLTARVTTRLPRVSTDRLPSVTEIFRSRVCRPVLWTTTLPEPDVESVKELTAVLRALPTAPTSRTSWLPAIVLLESCDNCPVAWSVTFVPPFTAPNERSPKTRTSMLPFTLLSAPTKLTSFRFSSEMLPASEFWMSYSLILVLAVTPFAARTRNCRPVATAPVCDTVPAGATRSIVPVAVAALTEESASVTLPPIDPAFMRIFPPNAVSSVLMDPTTEPTPAAPAVAWIRLPAFKDPFIEMSRPALRTISLSVPITPSSSTLRRLAVPKSTSRDDVMTIRPSEFKVAMAGSVPSGAPSGTSPLTSTSCPAVMLSV